MDNVEAGNQDTPRKTEVTPQDFSITAFKRTKGFEPVGELNADASSSSGGGPDKVGTENPTSRGGEDVIQKAENERVGDKTKWSGKGQKWIMIVGFLLAIITLAIAGYMYFLQ